MRKSACDFLSKCKEVSNVNSAISVYIAMNNEEQDVKKKIMMVVGACLFLIAAAQALPLFFGIDA